MISTPGVYDISEAEYHADPCPEPSLSASILKVLVSKTPMHAAAKHPRLTLDREADDRERFDIGKAAHSLMLGDPKDFVIVDADDWRTKDAKAERDEAYAEGKIPLLAKHWERLDQMHDAGMVQLQNHEEASDAFAGGLPERTLIWQEGPVWCRARLDWLPDAGVFYDDYKSTEDASPQAFGRVMDSLEYGIQAVFYARGIRALGLCDKPIFRFIAQEIAPPFALSVHQLMPEALEIAEQKVAFGIKLWGECLAAGVWPGYSRQTYHQSPSAWKVNQWLERQAAAEYAQEQK